jgi:hypothetical protein
MYKEMEATHIVKLHNSSNKRQILSMPAVSLANTIPQQMMFMPQSLGCDLDRFKESLRQGEKGKEKG